MYMILAYSLLYLKQVCAPLHKGIQQGEDPGLFKHPAFLRMPNPEKEEGKQDE